MQIINALILSTIAGLSTVFGSFIVFLKIKNTEKFITFCLSFTAIIMLGISILELFPESFFTLLEKYSFISTVNKVIIIFIIGIVVIKLINKLIDNQSSLYKIGVLNMIALMLHNFPEGITTFLTSLNDINLGLKISIAIMFHNIPEGIAIASPIYIATKSRKKAIIKTFISGISEPIGALVAYIFLKDYVNPYLISFVIIVVCAIMTSLSVEKLLPEAINHRNPKILLYGFISGIIILLLTMYIL